MFDGSLRNRLVSHSVPGDNRLCLRPVLYKASQLSLYYQWFSLIQRLLLVALFRRLFFVRWQLCALLHWKLPERILSGPVHWRFGCSMSCLQRKRETDGSFLGQFELVNRTHALRIRSASVGGGCSGGGSDSVCAGFTARGRRACHIHRVT